MSLAKGFPKYSPHDWDDGYFKEDASNWANIVGKLRVPCTKQIFYSMFLIINMCPNPFTFEHILKAFFMQCMSVYSGC